MSPPVIVTDLATLAYESSIEFNVYKQQKKLLTMRHAYGCKSLNCKLGCKKAKELWSHVLGCRDPLCSVEHCKAARAVADHCRKKQKI